MLLRGLHEVVLIGGDDDGRAGFQEGSLLRAVTGHSQRDSADLAGDMNGSQASAAGGGGDQDMVAWSHPGFLDKRAVGKQGAEKMAGPVRDERSGDAEQRDGGRI
jgi:hypothetical protein